MRLGRKLINTRADFYVIAEIGVNHEANIDLAKRLIYEAREGGADAVKFQSYKAETIAALDAVSYWDTSKESEVSQVALFKKYDGFNPEDYKILQDYSQELEIDFCSTPFDLDSVDFLDPLVEYFKIASADITNYPLIRKIASKKKPILLSTGASNIVEIKNAVNELQKYGATDICIMHCILNYPTEKINANLLMIENLREEFPTMLIGYSDHTTPDEFMILLSSAVALGAQVIEKHFTHDKTIAGNDHYHSMDIKDLRQFTKNLSVLKEALGAPQKHSIPSEAPARENARRSLHYSRALVEGEVLTIEDFISLRPAVGISPAEVDTYIGKELRIQVREFERIRPDHFK
jgi:sialic acid synthase SpsE